MHRRLRPARTVEAAKPGVPSSSNTIIVTPDAKTTVPRTFMREQADFRLNDALRNVPGINRR